MTNVITQYDPDTGEMDAVLSADTPIIESTKAANPYWIDGQWDGDTHYVVDGEAVPRPENPTTLDGMTLRNVPVPATLTINETEYQTDSDTVELGFDYPGTYRVIVRAFPYLDKELTIEDTAP